MLKKTEEDADYITLLYEVLGMQENLSNYALRLVQVTMEQWDVVYQEELRSLQMVPLLIFGLAVIVMGFSIIIWQLLIGTMVKPLIGIAEESRKIAVNDFSSPELVVENEDEIGELVSAFNKMKKAMGDYIATLKEKNKMTELLHKEEMEKVQLEKNLDQARLEVLKHQVNPHFLFNTLNMISCMARIEDAETTDKMIVSLGNLFRYNLRTVEQEVYLYQEIEVLDDYIYIQQMRFDGRIEYQKHISVNVYDVKIPSFTLQPIVENAFIHGVSKMEENGRVVLKIWEKEQNVIITIADNGYGMQPEELKEINTKVHKTNTSGRGIGLGNICRRVDMLYPNGQFHIFSKQGKGTIVKIVIPQKQEGENDV